jgi:hypothetical protein
MLHLQLQSDKSNIADSANEFLSLLQNPVFDPYKKVIEEKMDTALTGGHWCAYFFHPTYRGDYKYY